jgi:hypothetical protein
MIRTSIRVLGPGRCVGTALLLLALGCTKQEARPAQPTAAPASATAPAAAPPATASAAPTPSSESGTPPPPPADTQASATVDAGPPTPTAPTASASAPAAKPTIANGRFTAPAFYRLDSSASPGKNSGGRLMEGSPGLYTFEFNPDGSARQLLGDAYGGGNYVIKGNTVTFTAFKMIPTDPDRVTRLTTTDRFMTLLPGPYRFVPR